MTTLNALEKEAYEDSTSIKVLTIITLLYLPSTVVLVSTMYRTSLGGMTNDPAELFLNPICGQEEHTWRRT